MRRLEVFEPKLTWCPAALAVARVLIVWSVWATATFTAISYIGKHGRNLPMFEDLYVVPVMTGHQPMSLQWAATQHNEHRMVVPKLILAGLLRTIPDFRSGLYLNVALMSAAAASMLMLVRRLRGSIRLVDTVLPLSILNIGQAECFLIGFALNLVMTAWISCELIGVVSRTTRSPSWWSCLQAGGFLVLLPLCGGSGIALLPPIVVWLAGYVACGWWSEQDPGRSARALGVGLLMATSAIVTWYLLGYVRPSSVPAAPSVSAMWATMLQALSLVISPSRWGYWMAAGWAVLLLTTVTVMRLAHIAWRSPVERPRALGLCAVTVALLGVATSVGVSRSGSGPSAGLASRYTTILAPLISVLYVTWLLYGPAPARRAIHISLLALICAGLPAQSRTAREMGRSRCTLYVKIENALESGMPSSQIMNLACPIFHPDRAMIYESFKMLQQARVGRFRYMVDDGLAAKYDGLSVVR
jgi:hypothetical protein